MRNLAIIPARSGSKGLKDKNIKILAGKPLIAHSISAAIESGIFDEIFVSTDSAKYAEIAKQWGAHVPFLRDTILATDSASTWDVVKSALRLYESNGETFDLVTLLQPTSPLRTNLDIIGAFNLFNKLNANAVISVCEMDHSPLWSNTIGDDLSLVNFIDSDVSKFPRQSLPTYYRLNGAIYILKVDYLFNTKSIYDEKCYAYIMDKKHSIDIDDEYDLIMADSLLSRDI